MRRFVKSHFPTIREMENAILFVMGDNMGKCNYQQDSYTFLAVEMVPYPVRDDGGSIDSIDFDPIEHTFSFKEAYNMWESMEELFKQIQKGVAPKPVSPYPTTEIDDILPF